MPTYEFECPSGHQFERFYRKISDGVSELPCPVCGKVATRRMSVGGGLIFKGSGFYITDYGKDGKKAQGSATSSASGGDGSSGGSASASSESSSGAASADAKPATKSESKPAESKPAAKSGDSGSSAAPKPGGSPSKPSSSE